MDRPRLQVSWITLCGLASIALLLATGASAPAHAGSCWGCVEYVCTPGHETGGYLCEVGEIECSLAAKIFFGCKSRWCKTSATCRPSASEIGELAPSIYRSPDDPEQPISVGAPASPAIVQTHPALWQPAAENAPLP